MNSRDTTTTRPTTGKTDVIPALRKPQIRILKCLADGRARTKPQMRKDSGVLQGFARIVGAHNEEIRARNDVNIYPSLITLGLVRIEKMDVGGQDIHVYEITAKGKRVVASLAAESTS
jgi:hypothetical protein